jgi:hypothetical protein
MNKIINDFVLSEENPQYKFKIGRTVASSLTGFIFGAIFSSIIWFVAARCSDIIVLHIFSAV